MTTRTAAGFRIQAISAGLLQRVRSTRLDASGLPVEHVTAEGGEPIRCCLRDAARGEQLMLFGYEPPLPPSPYREVGAVFAHAEACDGLTTSTAYPEDWCTRPQVLRAYDSRGWIHRATRVHDGSDPEAEIAAVLAHDDVTQIHSRNIAYGCFMFVITPADCGSE